MVGVIGSGVGAIGVSLARKGGHGHSNGQPPRDSGGPSGYNRPDRGNGVADSPTISGDRSQAAIQSEAFEIALRSVALQLMNDAMADADEAMAETEEDS
ncbi:nodulation protein NopC [Sinorhizobium sp. BJ1]|uniref:nodulation protein NopC n=1 Tax=Sinorhizobium sp. BJ1 TaxID=2035455 RepID=UPI000BE9F911|nr:nodulation protein NopC [Sinorhizobium sp. BJ1]PDT80400.1 nodulation protein NopC [Sinorhizobium sp. BJ1]